MPSGLYYSNEARELDNYIYTNRTVEIVAAGEGSGSSRNFANIAHAVNAITVGAKDPTSGNATAYTPNVKPRYCISGIGNCNENSSYGSYRTGTAKPEISNYSHFYFDEGGNKTDKGRKYTLSSGTPFTYNPYYDGTAISAAYTAGMVSDLLATNAFYRRHPEVVKAVLITSASVKGVPTYSTLLPPRSYTDVNHAYPYKHDSRFWVGDIDKIKTHEVDGRKQIRFKIKTSDFESNDFVAAISWLSSGDDIANLAKIPQDFDLRVYTSSTGNLDELPKVALSTSTSSTNAFEKISFSTSSNYMVFVITLYSDDANSENHGQVVLGFDLMSR